MSERSRLQEVIEIGDLGHSESVRYLTERDVDESVASSVVSFAGGRISLLKDAQLRLMRNQSIEGMYICFLFVLTHRYQNSIFDVGER